MLPFLEPQRSGEDFLKRSLRQHQQNHTLFEVLQSVYSFADEENPETR
jgi:hypothetical protein